MSQIVNGTQKPDLDSIIDACQQPAPPKPTYAQQLKALSKQIKDSMMEIAKPKICVGMPGKKRKKDKPEKGDYELLDSGNYIIHCGSGGGGMGHTVTHVRVGDTLHISGSWGEQEPEPEAPKAVPMPDCLEWVTQGGATWLQRKPNYKGNL